MLLASVIGGAVGYVAYHLAKLVWSWCTQAIAAIAAGMTAAFLAAVLIDVTLAALHFGTEQLAKSIFQFSIWGGVMGCFMAFQSWKAGKP